ncbi:hypothetical protein ACGFWF_38100 [Streptomyces sp. NPDC048581]|uniref:hypothetical protein n=1 Tax=Streptomyces sp. NPDC048581 TaxID=3365572 RepID=UPI00370FF486
MPPTHNWLTQIGHLLRRGRRGGYPPGFDTESCKQRNTVERGTNRDVAWEVDR